MQIQTQLTPQQCVPKIETFVELATEKVLAVHDRWDRQDGSPVITVKGRYTSRSWTDWTLGFFIGQALLLFDMNDDDRLLRLGRERTLSWMPSHVTHTGVHDHGFNNLSTYGNLRRLILEERNGVNTADLAECELALKVSGAVQAMRYQMSETGKGYIYSFNGPHSLFADTIRSMRSLVMSHQLGHILIGEGEARVNLLYRALEHAETTSIFNVYYGEGRDTYDVPGRVVHESIFNVNDGKYRCPSTQQGYSPFTTWTRGASWVILGFAELLEYLPHADEAEFSALGGRESVQARYERLLRMTCDYYIDGYTCKDGIPFWDVGAPGLVHLPDYQSTDSDPYNPYEPVDSSAAAITAQGLIRFGKYLQAKGDSDAERYIAAGLTIAETLFSEPYLSTDPTHEGLILHSIYHQPRGFDYVPDGSRIPYGESSLWGDYHAVELALLISRMASGQYYSFFDHT
ncbi:MAG: glycoside hydrolase family 88 protein [Anaerolineae bacterium]|nr:glycoside hydrolase family 88 protein [Anaerolineae bacterium]